MTTNYFEHVVELLRQDATMQKLGFSADDINWYGKGLDHHDLMVFCKPNWTVFHNAAVSVGYEGVNVHFESRRPGSLQIDCELTKRQGSESKAPPIVQPLRELKIEITRKIRATYTHFGLDKLGANLRGVRRDDTDPRSLKVLGFDLGLSDSHQPDDFVNAIRNLIEPSTRLIESSVARASVMQSPATTAPKTLQLSEKVFILPPVPDAETLLQHVQHIRGQPERNMEAAVVDLLIGLGHRRCNIQFQMGHIDIRVSDSNGKIWMILEVKRALDKRNLHAARDQAFGYAEKVDASLVVITDSNVYVVYDRRRGGGVESMFCGQLQLTKFLSTDAELLSLLRPQEPTGGESRKI